ncbi:MAG TPA: MOSC domain-containing protein [Miltoncostaeaceae bacterium]|nr:MOSC domain-containing protein [Miltoncostaeaceae bacterium]
MSDLWRFPVKSFGGERARRAFVGPFGLLGDRRHAVEDGDGTPLSARRAHALLGFAARYADHDAAEGAGVTTPSGFELDPDDPALARELSELVGRPVRVVRSAVGVHDAAPVHLVSTASLAAASGWLAGEEVDVRRFRANVVLELERPEPFAEMGWGGALLELGDGGPVLEVVSPTERCAVTTFDPDTLERDNRVLAGLARERDNLFGVYARVRRPGWAEVGATVRRARSGRPSA